jgi:arylsulfatase A-like enzyme
VGDRDRSLRQALGDGVAFGGLVGLCHGVAETTLTCWYGVDLTVVDVLVSVVAYGMVAGVAVSALASVLFLSESHIGWPAASRPWLAAAAAFGYAGVIGLESWRHGSAAGSWAPAAALVFGVVTLVAAAEVVRAAHRWARVVSGALALAFAAAGGRTFWIAHSATQEASQPELAVCLAAPGAVLLALSLTLRSRGDEAGWRRALRPIAVVVAALAATLALRPLPLRWHVIERGGPSVAAEPDRPDVFLIVLDTVGADHLELFGYHRETMPHLTEFAREESAVAAAVLATAPSSLPSHASLFTGLHASAHGAHKPFLADPNPPAYAYFLRQDVPTLAEFLVGIGYEAIGISGNFIVLSSYGLSRGFTYFDVRPSGSHLARELSALSVLNARAGDAVDRVLPQAVALRTLTHAPALAPYRRAAELTDLALGRLRRTDGPAFLFLNYFDAHDPYLPVPEHDQLWEKCPAGTSWVGFPDEAYDRLNRGEEGLPDDELACLVAQYDAELRYLDAELKRLLDGLRDMGRLPESIVFIVSDHGEAFQEHGFLRHSTSVYSPQVKVPFLVRLPDSADADLPPSAETMQFIDVLPTVAALLDVDLTSPVQGSAWATGRSHSMSEVFVHQRRYERLRRELCAVAIGSMKYVWSSTGDEELYDLAADPSESANLAGSRPELEERARAVVRERAEYMVNAPARGVEGDRLLDNLRALGYVQ